MLTIQLSHKWSSIYVTDIGSATDAMAGTALQNVSLHINYTGHGRFYIYCNVSVIFTVKAEVGTIHFLEMSYNDSSPQNSGLGNTLQHIFQQAGRYCIEYR